MHGPYYVQSRLRFKERDLEECNVFSQMRNFMLQPGPGTIFSGRLRPEHPDSPHCHSPTHSNHNPSTAAPASVDGLSWAGALILVPGG